MSNQLTLFDIPSTRENEDYSEKSNGKPRLKHAVRNQVEMIMKSLDELLPKEHLVPRIAFRTFPPGRN